MDNIVGKNHIAIHIWNVNFGNENIEKTIESHFFKNLFLQTI